MINILVFIKYKLWWIYYKWWSYCGVGCRQVCVAALHGSNWCDAICQNILQLPHDRLDLLDQLLMLWGAVCHQ